MSRPRRARLERAAAELRRARRGGDAAATLRAAMRDPAGAPTEEAAAMGVRIRIALYMMRALDGFGEAEVLEDLARDGVHLAPPELEEARRSLRVHLASFGAEAGAAWVTSVAPG
jgi:hypothetical protein